MKPFLEHIILDEKESAMAFRYDKSDFVTPWHFHPQHELTYIEESSGTKFIGDFVGSYHPGELVLLKSYLPHCWKNFNNENTAAISTVVQWNSGVIPDIPEMIRLSYMMNHAAKGIIYQSDDIQDLLPTVLSLPSLSGPELILHLLQLLSKLSECSYKTLSEVSFADGVSSEVGNRISMIHEFVANNYNRKVKLKELAELLSMSEQSFSRFFKKMMGRSFFTFLGEYRIRIASRMLIDTDWPVSRVGYACGYESIPFFYKQFKQLKGHSPLKLRLNHKKALP